MTSRPGWPSDPEVLAFIEETAKHYPESANRASAEEARRNYDALCEAFDSSHPRGVVAHDTIVTAKKPRRKIPIRRYHAEDPEPDEGGGDTPFKTESCLMYLHGGGWVVGGLDSHDSICAELCAGTDVDVVAVDYRLCPEHRHPAALDDAEAVFHDLAKIYKHVIVGGDSAGGHLTAALCMRLRAAGASLPVAQLLIYPALGANPEGGSYETNADAPGLTTADVVHYWDVLADGNDWRTTDDPELAPLRATDFSGLPPAIITSAGCDPLRDDALAYATRLTEAGVPVQWRNDPELVHGHLRGRFMIGTAMAHFVWICIALRDLAITADFDALMSDPEFLAAIDEMMAKD